MFKLDISGALDSVISGARHSLAKNAPKLLVGTGIVGVIVSGVLACRATLTANEIVKDAKAEIEETKESTEEGKEQQKALTGVFLRTTAKVVKVYLVPVGIGALSIAGIVKSHNMLTEKNAALATAYVAVSTAFSEYQGRVAAKYGEDEERRIRYNLKDEVIEEDVTDEKTGKTKKVKKTVQTINGTSVSGYARVFGPRDANDPTKGSAYWDKSNVYNETLFFTAEAQLNRTLRGNGYVFLNDVYDLLGLSRSIAGQAVGWVYDRSDPTGDNRIVFKKIPIVETDEDGRRNYVTLVDFNVDGPILDQAKNRNLITV